MAIYPRHFLCLFSFRCLPFHLPTALSEAAAAAAADCRCYLIFHATLPITCINSTRLPRRQAATAMHIHTHTTATSVHTVTTILLDRVSLAGADVGHGNDAGEGLHRLSEVDACKNVRVIPSVAAVSDDAQCSRANMQTTMVRVRFCCCWRCCSLRCLPLPAVA